MTLWMVRAGKNGEREELSLEQNISVIGWEEVPDLSSIRSRDELPSLLSKIYPNEKINTVRNWERQIWPFILEMSPGDLVALPLKRRPAIAIGEVTGEYRYRPDLPPDARHTRAVKWIGEFSRSLFDQDLLYSLGAFMTVCRIQRNRAEDRVRSIVFGEPIDIASLPPSEVVADDEIAYTDIEELTRDEIRDYISKKFRGHELTRLVGAILTAQGYQVQISRPGADGGVDIIAGKGLLGFDHPRLVVQVKSSDTPVDVKIVRELQGVMKNFQADHGLLVSWGGYTTPVAKETATKFFEIRLWNSEDLIQMLQTHYDAISEEMQADLPLKKIWMLVPEENE